MHHRAVEVRLLEAVDQLDDVLRALPVRGEAAVSRSKMGRREMRGGGRGGRGERGGARRREEEGGGRTCSWRMTETSLLTIFGSTPTAMILAATRPPVRRSIPMCTAANPPSSAGSACDRNERD